MYKKKKQKINANESSAKYGQVNRPFKKWIQEKPFMKIVLPL